MHDPTELTAWLRLTETPGIGRASARRLLAAFGDPQAVLAAPRQAWLEWLSPAQADALAKPSADLDALVQRSRDWLACADGAARSLVTLGDPAYPRLLLETADPPLLLYALGRSELLNAPGVAVVGSRNPTPQGLENARAFAAALSDHGLTVVSGLALGIDGAAHEGALEGPGRTIAVVGTGLDRVYPKRHLGLARRIAEQGLLVSEYPLGTPPVATHFPRRNRVIAGMTSGTLVVEAALASGSLITARLAVESGREVFAIPGSIHSPQSKGCHALIKEGARLVEAASDILEELHLGPAATDATRSRMARRWVTGSAAGSLDDAPAPPGGTGDPLLDALGFESVTLDALSARLGEAPAALSARLLELELAGQVVRRPGQLFQRLVCG